MMRGTASLEEREHRAWPSRYDVASGSTDRGDTDL